MHGLRLRVYKMFLLLNDYSMGLLRMQEIIFPDILYNMYKEH